MKQLSLTDVLIPANCIPPFNLSDGKRLNQKETPERAASPHSSTRNFTEQNIHIRGTTISVIGQQIPDASSTILSGSGCFALPGFIDLHVHGGMGADTMDAEPAALGRMAHFFAQHGVTSFCPTTMTAPHEQIIAAIKGVNKATVSKEPTSKTLSEDATYPTGARMLGIHIEGPYISPLFPGAQSVEYVRPPKIDEFRTYLEAGPVKMITIAPEEPGATQLIKLARKEGVVVIIGHTNATYDECVEAIALGASQATHTYNAMSGLHHRRPGTLGATLSHDAIDAQLIADNIHVHPAAMKILCRCKGVGGTILITDAMRAAGLAEGEYSLGDQVVTVKDGACRLADGTLAGSILTMDKALINFMAATGLRLNEAWPATSRSAAHSLGLDNHLGSIGPGYWADLVLLDQDYAVVATIVGGEVVYLRDSERLHPV